MRFRTMFPVSYTSYQRFTACLLHVCYSSYMRHQRGYVYEASGSFFVRYYSSGAQRSHRLCSKDHKFYSRTCRPVKMLADEFMQTVNAGKGPNVKDLTVADFWRETYQPFTVENLRHSTVYGYRHVWAQHLEKHFGTVTLREYRTHMGSAFLTGLSKTLCRSTVQHIRSLASGIFSHAVNLGLIESNPWHDVKVLGKSRPPGDTAHYTLEEAENIISALVEHPDCQTILALACFTGLRPGEIQGLRWSDIEEDWIHIRRSIVRGKEGGLKTASSTASLPLIAPVKIPLALWRQKAGDNERVFPRDLKTLVKLTIAPTLRAKGLQWKGLYAGRRGAATVLTELTGDALAAKELLRHSNIGVTQQKYVKKIPEALLRGMKLLEAATK
jgi:integrase